MTVDTLRQGVSGRWSVGIIGAGLAARSLHLPVLAGMSDQFLVRAVWDIDPDAATAMASLCGARAAASLEDLLAGDAFDVVVVCSPAHLHAEHAIAAIRASARIVLIEKPLCSSAEEARAIGEAAQAAGSAVIVGAMHLFDAGWTFLKSKVEETEAPARSLQLRIILPPNGRYEQWSTEKIEVPPAPSPLAGMAPSALIDLLIMGLGIHDLPLVRRLLPENAVPKVASARLLSPFGFSVDLVAGDVAVNLLAFLNRHWLPNWSLTAIGSDWHGRVDFTPSFVPAGSASASFTKDGQVESLCPQPINGYQGEWLAIAEVLTGAAPAPDYAAIEADLSFAIEIATQAGNILGAGEAQ